MATTRAAIQTDLSAILELTRANRTLLARLEPSFWHKSPNADEIHREFITFQVANEHLTKRVLERNGRVIGYAVSSSHPSGFYFIDDVCLAGDADWLTDGTQLLRSIEERPAIMTAPHLDTARVEAARAIGLEQIGTVRSLRFDHKPPPDSAVPTPINTPEDLAPALLHVWLPAMAPERCLTVEKGRF